MVHIPRRTPYHDLSYEDQVQYLVWRSEILNGRPTLAPLTEYRLTKVISDIFSAINPSEVEGLTEIPSNIPKDVNIMDQINKPKHQPKTSRPPGMPDNHPDVLAGIYI